MATITEQSLPNRGERHVAFERAAGRTKGAFDVYVRGKHPIDTGALHMLSGENERHVQEAARLLARGKVLVWDLHTPGFLVDGTNPRALKRLRKLKGVEETRPFVSMVPWDRIGDWVDIGAHTPEIQAMLQDTEMPNLIPEGASIFFRMRARPHLRPPLVQLEDGGENTIIILMQNNPLMRRLYEETFRQKQLLHPGENISLSITGSSANAHGTDSPNVLREVDPHILVRVAGIIDLKGPRGLIDGTVPIMDIRNDIPTILRQGTGRFPDVADKIMRAMQERYFDRQAKEQS